MSRRRSIRATLAAQMNTFFLVYILHLLRPRTWTARASGEAPTTRSADDPTFFSPPGAVSHTQIIRCYHDLAQRLRQLLPPTCTWLGSSDVQITDATAFSSGGFAEVWRGSIQGLPVVVKSFRCYSSPEFDSADIGIRFLREVWASTQLSHPNVVPFLGVYCTPTHPFALIYKMREGLDLGQYLANRPDVSRLKLLVEISRGLRYMHSLDIIHGKIKMRNILVGSDGIACLGGLGSAFSLTLPASWSDTAAERLFCGLAPELINPHTFGFVHARATKATDMFAFGMLAWEIFAGSMPFPGKVEAAIIFSVFKNDRPARPNHPEVSDGVWNAIQRCWDRDPFQRMTADDVVDLLEAEMQRAPNHSPWRPRRFVSADVLF